MLDSANVMEDAGVAKEAEVVCHLDEVETQRGGYCCVKAVE